MQDVSNAGDAFFGYFEKFKAEIKSEIRDVKSAIQKSNSYTLGDTVEWIPGKKFLELAGVSNSQMQIWRNQGHMDGRIKKIGKKLYVHRSCIDDYFDGKFVVNSALN